MGEVIYLRKEYVEEEYPNCLNDKKAVENVLTGIGGFLILYGFYCLVRDIQGR